MRLAILLALLLGLASFGRPRPPTRCPSSAEAGPSCAPAHAGQPTVIHFWGLTCGPCLVELPQWGDAAGRRGPTSGWC